MSKSVVDAFRSAISVTTGRVRIRQQLRVIIADVLFEIGMKITRLSRRIKPEVTPEFVKTSKMFIPELQGDYPDGIDMYSPVNPRDGLGKTARIVIMQREIGGEFNE